MHQSTRTHRGLHSLAHRILHSALPLAWMLVMAILPATNMHAAVPPSSHESVDFSGLTNPTAVRFASDRRVLRCREKWLDQSVRQSHRYDADDLRRRERQRL
jgi:hypothetical protein